MELPFVNSFKRRSSVFNFSIVDHVSAAYQAILTNHDHKVVGYEALARLEHPAFAQVSTERLVAHLEGEGQISLLTHRMLCNICRDQESFRGEFVALNVSANDLSLNDFPGTVLQTLDAHGIEADHLHIEVTETEKINSTSQFRVLDHFQRLGVKTYLDDYGSGHATHERLVGHHWSRVKLDGQLVQGCLKAGGRGIEQLHLLSSRLSSLGHEVVAEGVETEAHKREIGKIPEIGFVQGYAFGRPAPVGSLEI